MSPVAHELKIWPEFFDAVICGTKRFEIRRHDRPYCVGDLLVLREWAPSAQAFTGQSVTVRVTYMVKPGEWGLPEDVCVLGIAFPSEADHVEREAATRRRLKAVTTRLNEGIALAMTDGSREVHALLSRPLREAE